MSPTSPISFPAWPVHDANQRAAVERVLRSGRTNQWTGSDVLRFEQCWSRLHDGRATTALANGSLALEAALLSLGVETGDHVLVPCRTFIACAMAVVRVGAIPVLCDVDKLTGLVTIDTLERACTPRAKAAIIVHLEGRPADMVSIVQWATSKDIALVEDVSQAHGATLHGHALGTFGDAAVWSFCQDKIISTGGEGGMVACASHDTARRIRALRDHGRRTEQRFAEKGFAWVRASIGTNLRMTGMQAAIGSVQTAQLDAWRAQRLANAHVLRDRLDGIANLHVPWPVATEHWAWYRCMVHVHEGDDRDQLVQLLQQDGFPVTVGACPDVGREEAMQTAAANADQHRPGALVIGRMSMALPVHPTAGFDDMHRLADAVLAHLDVPIAQRSSAPSATVMLLQDRVVAVTGGAGSIGRHLVPFLLGAGARRVVLIDRAEASLHVAMQLFAREARVTCVLLDIADEGKLQNVLQTHGVQDLVHAAAHKHVPMVEANPVEGLQNNALGTGSVLAAAEEAGVQRLLLMSTDKALSPAGVMGASKRIAEQFVRSHVGSLRTAVFRCCNVLDSDGSVTDVFRQRLLRGEPLEIVHPEASRWFKPMEDVCRNLVQALAMARDGRVFVPKVESPVCIVDLARTVAASLGLGPDDIDIHFTGLRPGERLVEHGMSLAGLVATPYDDVLEAIEDLPELAEVQAVRDLVEQVCAAGDASALRTVLGLDQSTAPAAACSAGVPSMSVGKPTAWE
jgi:dTDP-4-amino-4,6-dideoxygalactose transaminase/nucleoside-diphosphate-sugar epimerase